MTPYFSLILPVYNVSGYLERCIESILVQDFKDYEIILVDDGSTDASAEICDRYAETHSNIRVIHKANGGLSSARNAGFEIAKGEYIWWIDSDDWIEKHALEDLYGASYENTPDIIKFHYYRIEKERKEILCSIEPGLYIGEKKVGDLLDCAFHSSSDYLLSACFHVYRRMYLISTGIGFVSERLVGSEDFLFNLSVLPMAHSICVLPKPLYVYEMRGGSLSQTYKLDLADRYECLHRLLLETYQSIGILDRYRKEISYYYVWHLIRGTCITQEYQVLKGHSLKDGRRNVKEMLRSRKLQEALSDCDTGRLSRKQRIMMLAMKRKSELFFYYLYVLKPKIDRCI